VPLLDDAQKRFEAYELEQPGRGAERMAFVCFAERGDCLRDLGRFDESAAAYEESIRRAEKIGDDGTVAVAKGQLGTVRMLQHRYKEALDAYKEARECFTRLTEPSSIAALWHLSGVLYQRLKHPEAAEDAYRKSLEIAVRLGDVAGQAKTLLQLGNLYCDVFGRLEEAAEFYRLARDKYIEIPNLAYEGVARNNVAETLRKLGCFDEARQEILRAIESDAQFGLASEPWTAWHVLEQIETGAGNATAAEEAKRKAIASYLTYRQQGGENHSADGHICLAVTESLLAGDSVAAASRLQELASDPQLPAWLRPFIQPLQAIVAGSHDRILADTPGLHYKMAAEILFLLETLEKPR
jgi:tetratricopeptide (TPR) repeat protein